MRPSYYVYPGLKQNLLTVRQLNYLKCSQGDPASLYVIFLEVCKYFHLPPENVRKPCRKRELVWARQLYCYLAKKFTSLSLNQIGEVIGGKDHTTVIHSNTTANNLIKNHADLKDDAMNLERIVSDKLYIENMTVKDLSADN